MKTVCIGPGDAGRTIQLDVGDRLIISLPENPTTGFLWQVPESLGPMQRIERQEYEAATGGIGSGTHRHIEFECREAGRIELELLRMQAWESPESADDSFSLAIEIG